ncbi:MAG: type III pantothenate kinase [Rhodospirillaceae bacterium]|jgi:type III pantothenate kinase|nr:type III pantothenate kinase [Rhodospirillaceae bacterium]MBT4488646.1 type III pantothenate kinase [Rhodospirillaceae bacterium]MBT5192922.1 type III pantothenate kinase [Rhodospirillaceae bacterium]MBT5897931.1 type III pantothenate kinase [Rhodospirillaceae bacterium]MBT6427371.1 type III pantothenate kinase [Rhodospirillaceae bacterium]
MLLAINANNTNVKFALFDGDTIVGEWRQHTSAFRTADEHAVWLSQLFDLNGIDRAAVTDTVIACVVPQALFNLSRLCSFYFNSEPLVLGDEETNYGVEIRATPPVGADRICNTVGAGILFPGQPAVVVDFGTATTFDVVDEDGNYCGGVIAPGINLSLEALHNATALLPRIVVAKPEKIIGTDTVACMHSGVFWGYVGLIEGIVHRICAEFGRPMKIISTGGLAPVFDEATDVIEAIVPDITPRGLREIYRRSRGV